jgi:uncharacterized SAM-binding protein YcdF (DUF218 family)
LETCRFRSNAPGILPGALAGALAGLLLDRLGLTGLLPDRDWLPPLLQAGLVVGLFAGVVGRAICLWFVDVALLATSLIVGYTTLMPRAASAWVRNDPLPATAQAVAVLSSSVSSDTALDQFGIDRLLTGLELVSERRATRLVTSRVDRPFRSGRVSTDADQRRIIRLIDSTVAWSMVDNVHSTRDEAVRMARLLLPGGVRRIYLVTSPLHTRRACATFEAVGFTVVCHAAREHGHPAWHPETPEDRLESFRQYIYERLGMLKYQYNGWVA